MSISRDDLIFCNEPWIASPIKSGRDSQPLMPSRSVQRATPTFSNAETTGQYAPAIHARVAEENVAS